MIEVYETENSVYEFDEDNGRFRRGAKPGREQFVHSHRLVYGEWLPLASFELRHTVDGTQQLRIMAPDSTHGVFTSDVLYVTFKPEADDDEQT